MNNLLELKWKLTMPKEMYKAWRAAGSPNPAEWAWAEITHLREFEAREAIVTNLMAAWVEVLDGKRSMREFDSLVRSSDAELCRAVECLARRDAIRSAEGEIRALSRAQAAFQHPDLNVDAYFDLEIGRLQRDLAKARAGK